MTGHFSAERPKRGGLSSGWYVGRALLLAVVAASLLVALPSYALAQSASVTATSPVDRGSSGYVSLSIGAPEIGAFELVISCSPGGILRFDSVSAGSGPSGFIIVDNITGKDSAAVSGFMSTTPVTQDLNVASISFTAVGRAGKSATISVSGAVYDPDGNTIQGVAFSSATVQVTGEDSTNLAPILGGIGGGLALIALVWLGIRNHKKSQAR